MFPLRRFIVAASTKLICVCCGGTSRSTSFCRSRGQTQRWPTELTGRGSSYWLSIHRSSPRVPGWPDQTRGGGFGGDVSGGSLQVTALPLELTYSFHMELLLHAACTRRLSRTHATFRSDEVTFTQVLEICAIWDKRGIKAKRRHQDGQAF